MGRRGLAGDGEHPADERGACFQGILQEGYPVGYLLAAVVYKCVFPFRRLAMDVFRRIFASVAGAVHPGLGRRVPCLGASQ